MTMMLSQMRFGLDRDFWLFDTFEGLPQPTKEDGAKAINKWTLVKNGTKKDRATLHGKWNWGPLSVVMNNIKYVGYPPKNTYLKVGKVEDTLQQNPLPERIAVLRLDTDFYTSTKAEFEILYDRLVPGGLLFVDDYCYWQGSTQATDDFFRSRGMESVSRASQEQNQKKLCLFMVKNPSASPLPQDLFK